MQLIRPVQVARPRHRHAVVPSGTALGRQQVVVAIALVQVRRLRQAVRRPLEDVLAAADQPPFRHRILLRHDARKAVAARPVVPQLVQQILAAVVVMEQRWIETAAVEMNGIGPRAVDARAGDQVIMEVAQGGAAGRTAGGGAAVALDVGIDQPEQAVRMGQARRPHAAGIRRAQHVELAGARERTAQQAPVDQVARVVDLHARIPLEGRRGDVIVAPTRTMEGSGLKPGRMGFWIMLVG